MCRGGGHALECLGDGKDTQTAVDGDITEPRHHGNTAVLEFCLTKEVDGGKVREAEGIEANISDISFAVGWGLEEGEGLGLGIQRGNRDCVLSNSNGNEHMVVSL